MSTSASIQDRPGLPMAGPCCAPLPREPITAYQAVGLAPHAEALADPTRLRLVSLVAARDDGEACVCDLTQPPALTQPTISRHLKILVDAGIFPATSAACGPATPSSPEVLNALAATLSTASQDPGPARPAADPGPPGRR